jgi:GntR family transcriptional regulator
MFGATLETINRHSKVPYYQQLYTILRGKIARDEWTPGDLIPTENELIDEYRVSRSTVRQVLDMLVSEGLVYRERGRGSFIAHPTVEQTMSRIVSFTEDMRQRGFEPGTRLLSASQLKASQDISASLQVPPGELLTRVERLRLADGEPMSVEESFLVDRCCPHLLAQDYTNDPLRAILERQYGLRLVNARQVIRAIPAPTNLADLLEIKPQAPLLFIERVSFSQAAIPVEFLRIYYRADRYSLYVELHE